MAFPEDLDPLVNADIDGASDAAVDDAARTLQRDISSRVRRTLGGDTMSNLPARLDVDVSPRGSGTVIELSPPGAFALAFNGSAPHRIVSRSRVLKFAGDTFRREVQHPGTRGNPLPEAEERNVDDEAERALEQELEQELP